jgi:adenylate cyclase
VKGEAGATLLEISRAAGIPHASVCGGRGRCTTCRVLVLEGSEHLPPPNATEAAALLRIKAPPGIRLACQIRPSHPLTVRPLIPLRASTPRSGQDDDRWGVERRVTILFADLRGFTRLAESLYPYDTVFLLNRYFEAMEQEIRHQGGRVDKFLGDGIMAVFDELSERRSGSREALEAAQAMLAALDELNGEFHSTLPQSLRIGIGIHTGPAILGRVGAGQERNVTALGDSVNVASRLEALNKEFGSVLIASDVTVRSSGLDIPGAERREVAIRGRVEPLRIHVLKSLRPSLTTSEPSPTLRACAGNNLGVRRV